MMLVMAVGVNNGNWRHQRSLALKMLPSCAQTTKTGNTHYRVASLTLIPEHSKPNMVDFRRISTSYVNVHNNQPRVAQLLIFEILRHLDCSWLNCNQYNKVE